jgi:hypothetical protein
MPSTGSSKAEVFEIVDEILAVAVPGALLLYVALVDRTNADQTITFVPCGWHNGKRSVVSGARVDSWPSQPYERLKRVG